MKIGIVGLGLLGGSLAASLKFRSERATITGFSGRESTRVLAEKSGYFDDIKGYDEINETLDSLDFLFLCTPIEVIKDNLRKIAECCPLEKKVIITDIGSTKGEIVDLADSLFQSRNDISFVGGHPMTGSEYSGFGAIDPHIYENSIYLITPSMSCDELDVNKLVRIVKKIGANPTIIDYKKHDRVAALISHFPQLVASLMTEMVSKDSNMQEAKKLAAGGFRDMTRIASSGYTMWKDIYKSNKSVIIDVIDTFIKRLTIAKEQLGKDELGYSFEAAAKFRDEIPRDMRGFLSAIWQLIVHVPDQPGVLNQITQVLFENDINLKDFSVVKIRERISGSIRLGFDTIEDRDLAQQLIENEGFKATKID